MVFGVNLNSLNQCVDQLGSKLPYGCVLSQTFQKHMQIDFVLFSLLQSFVAFIHLLNEFLLFFLVIGSHLHKTLVGDLAGDISFTFGTT